MSICRNFSPLIFFAHSFVFFSSISYAEYRAFQLYFKDKDGQIVRELSSTLDPDQYRGFYAVPNDLKIGYSKTWMCWGRTDQEPICPQPEPPPSPSDQNPTASP